MDLNYFKPTTLEQAIMIIVTHLTAEDIAFIRERGAVAAHHGFGTAMRNAWGLWDEDNPLHQYFRTRFGLGHADDMSGLILSGVECVVKGTTFDPQPMVDDFKAFWRASDIDPFTQQIVLKPGEAQESVVCVRKHWVARLLGR